MNDMRAMKALTAADASDPSPPALQVQALNVRLGDRTVVQDVGFTLARGATLALLGPSGCGKTTLLRAIAGLAAPAGGRIAIGGRDVGALPPQQRGVGLVFQQYALFPNLTVRENIRFGPLAQGWTPQRAAARADALLRLIDLAALAGQRPAQLSGGQRQRVAMARALAPEPALLLLDEPFSAIDESFRLPLRRAFRDLQRALQQSSVLVTHDRGEALELADEVAVMLEGRVAQIAPPQELLRRPASRAVARFLGAFNLFERLPAEATARLGAPPPAGWAAPVSALAVLGPDRQDAPDPAGLTLQATVTARHLGLHQAQAELRLDDGTVLTLLEGEQALAPGQRVRCRLPLSALHPLAA
ncbi:MAG: ABC transporter ATP-binding protein [Burkholderiales bacterium]|nr:ABC transporter ATP-binding protein [Burkholderiales bacterium]